MAQQREAIAALGTQLAFVHPGKEEQALPVMARYGVGDVARVADPGAILFRGFGLSRVKAWQFLKWATLRQAAAAWREGHRLGKPAGDVLLMPGVFLLRGDRVIRSFRHCDVAERPDYLSLARG